MTDISANGEALTYSQAVDKGMKFYHGNCRKHGSVLRWTSNRTCKICTSEQMEVWRRDNPKKRAASRRGWDQRNPEKAMLQRARRRARAIGVEFSLNLSDITIPERCPVLGLRLSRSDGNPHTSPSLDRINNAKGYVRGNVLVVSQLANRIKGAFALSDLKKVVNFYGQFDLR